MNLRLKKKSFFIPLNSMSDVAFLLLIFIMLVALINYRKEVKIEYPEAKTALKTNAKKNLEIWIDIEGNIFLDGETSNYLSLENKITELYINAPDTRVHIIADRNTPYEKINGVLEILQLLQYRVVSFVVKNNE
ncbi:MAG: biopolymer transporter ExbD [Spirochaetes bacterium]|nr:biopolymer transporter ExbD [Spirochaetota bacterium]